MRQKISAEAQGETLSKKTDSKLAGVIISGHQQGVRASPRVKRLVAAGALSLLLILFLSRSESQRDIEPRWLAIQRADFSITLTEVGELQAVRSTPIKAPEETHGELQLIELVDEGGFVQKGDLLLQFDDGYLTSELDKAKAELTAAQADLQQLQTEQAIQMQELMNGEKSAAYSHDIALLQLRQMQLESRIEKENVQLNLRQAEVSLKEAQTKLRSRRIINKIEAQKVRLRIEQAKLLIVELQRKIETLSIYAPTSGVAVYHEERQRDGGWKRPAPGDKVNSGKVILQLPDLSEMMVVFQVHELDRMKIETGQKVQVTLEALPKIVMKAQITKISDLPSSAGRSGSIKTYSVQAIFGERMAALKPGMTAKVEVVLAEHDSVATVPAFAVYEIAGEPVIFQKKDWPNPAHVTLLGHNDYRYGIAGDFNENDLVSAQCPGRDLKKFQRRGYADLRQQRILTENQFKALPVGKPPEDSLKTLNHELREKINSVHALNGLTHVSESKRRVMTATQMPESSKQKRTGFE